MPKTPNPFGFKQHPEARKMQGSNIYVSYLSSITSELLIHHLRVACFTSELLIHHLRVACFTSELLIHHLRVACFTSELLVSPQSCSSITSELLVSPQSCLKRCPQKWGETRDITKGQSSTCQSLGVVDFPMELSVLIGGSPKIGGLGAPPVLWEGSGQVTMPFHFRGIQSESKPTTRTQSTNFQPS